MTTAQWALLVACGSALFTGFNMLASWATYRRVPPRLIAKPKLVWDRDWDTGSKTLEMMLILINRGQSPITFPTGGVLQIQQISKFWWKSRGDRGRYIERTYFPLPENPQVPAHDGTRIVYRFTDEEVHVHRFHRDGFYRARVRVQLADNSWVVSKWTGIDIP
ncbi:hypothetical protein OHS59_16270 [Streptomyces sp. NBC_00414]|uniref:hypothetical protein n=1 Tax=Streptomyces sp. NBC_00414 TaxID=2975739 RepID=UPI002E206FCD